MSALVCEKRILSEFPPPAPEAWRRAAEESLEGGTIERRLVTKLPEGIDLQPIYSRVDAERLGIEAGIPGQFPYTRGSAAQGVEPWKICQELPYGNPAEFNQALLQDLNRGQNAVNLLLDVATRLGVDPDRAQVGDVGGCGLSVANVADLGRALAGVDLDAAPLYAQAGVAGPALVAMLTALRRSQGKGSRLPRGAVLSDPVGELLQRGSLPLPTAKVFDTIAETVGWAEENAPSLRVLGVQANLWAEGGGTAVHELGCGIATAVDYLRSLEARGVPPSATARRIMFTFSLGSHLFLQISKVRAARMLWARVLRACGVEDADCGLVCHGRSAMWNKSMLDPHVNLLRSTSEAFAGIVAGCESIHIAAYDDCFRVPDDFSRRLARNTQIILGDECHLGRVTDPSGGSWYIETLTKQLAEKAWELFQTIESQGGMCEALATGLPQREIERAATDRQLGLECRRDSVVGTNLQPNLRDTLAKVEMPDLLKLAAERSQRVMRQRDQGDVEHSAEVIAALSRIQESTPKNRVECMIEAFALGASLGEVAAVQRGPTEPSPTVQTLRFRRRSDTYESLRRRSEAFCSTHGRLPRVFLAKMGARKQHSARAEFSANFFSNGGFEVVAPRGFGSPSEAVAAAEQEAAPVVVICSTDDTYPELVPAIAGGLKALDNHPIVVLAGFPAEHVAAFRAAGVDEFIHLRANNAQVLSGILQKLGV